MRYEIIIPAVVWLLTLSFVAVVLRQTSRRLAPVDAARAHRHILLSGAALALSAAAVPAAIQALATNGAAFWAGVPLALVSCVFVFLALRSERPAKPAFMTFREKSNVVTILTIIGVYSWATWSFLEAPLELPAVFGFLVVTSVLMAIVMAFSHLALVVIRAPENEDERDRTIGWRSSRNGYTVTSIAAWGVLTLIFFGAGPAVVAYAILGVFVLAEIVRLASELAYSRLDL